MFLSGHSGTMPTIGKLQAWEDYNYSLAQLDALDVLDYTCLSE